MKSKNLIETKSFEFAIRIVGLYKYLAESKKEYVLSKQLLKSGTSIGANVSAGLQGMSKKDFTDKLYSFKRSSGNKLLVKTFKGNGLYNINRI